MSKVENIFREYAEATVGKSNDEVLEIIQNLIKKLNELDVTKVEKHLCLKFLEAEKVGLSEKKDVTSKKV